MWDSDTFVDYQQGINVAIKKVRTALGDSAEEPKYVQTVARKGYRFLVPVEVTAAQSATNQRVREPTPKFRFLIYRPWIFAGLSIGILFALGIWLFQMHAKNRHSTQIHSLAVLPLQNLSPDPGQDCPADGITEELITDFAQSLPMRVISRTSAMRYKETSEPITQIARELGVDAIVEGAVARSGERVTVTVQLIDATEDRHLWARKYDRDLSNLLDAETEISQEIATQVGSTVTAQRVIDSH